MSCTSAAEAADLRGCRGLESSWGRAEHTPVPCQWCPFAKATATGTGKGCAPARPQSRPDLLLQQPLQPDAWVQASRLLGIWAPVDAKLSEVWVRIVRPTAPWPFGKAERVDIDFRLPRNARVLEDLEFQPSDEDFKLDLPFEDEGDEEWDGDADDLDG
jgi:hypothetical protein